ncbi:uncharacterized protein [Salminus brasiliensis]|uniref:uncharacterized protein isoform X2 n=1 Tax=Salminus brasiliensis TaxID=930266 RepID=UPI003B82F02D
MCSSVFISREDKMRITVQNDDTVPAPRSVVNTKSDQSVEVSVTFSNMHVTVDFDLNQKRLPSSPNISMTSDQSKGRPDTFIGWDDVAPLNQERLNSPALSYTSMKSDKSIDRHIIFRNEPPSPNMSLNQERLTSSAPSNILMKSDQSVSRPVTLRGWNDVTLLNQERFHSPASSYISMKSEKSVDRHITFRNETPSLNMSLNQERLYTPASSYISMKSDNSMDRHITFRNENPSLNRRMKVEAAFPAPTCALVATNQSMDQLIGFKHGMKLETTSPAPTCASDASYHLTDRPSGLKRYCKTCFQTYWTEPTEGSYTCPQCSKRFKTRPALNPNSALAEVVQKLQQAGFSPAPPAHCYAGPEDVSCDFCTGKKLRAVKSCLTCSASYCEAHVKQHYTVPALQRHTLVDATVDLEERFCKLHHRALEVFCKTDQTFKCLMCIMDEHEGHETVLSKHEVPSVEVVNSVPDPVYVTEQLEYGKPRLITCNALREQQMMLQLLQELTVRTETAESELDYVSERNYRRLDQAKGDFLLFFCCLVLFFLFGLCSLFKHLLLV